MGLFFNSGCLKTKNLLFALLCFASGSNILIAQDMRPFKCENGRVEIKSDAPLELIEARTNTLKGIIDPSNQTFAWSVKIRYLEGFNSPLQREHFNENYMESTRYPTATFSGKIIEKTNFDKPGLQIIRAKGMLNIHGVQQERIIKCQVENKGGKLYVNAKFTVPVADHNIAIPRIVNQKIAEEIEVAVSAVMIR